MHQSTRSPRTGRSRRTRIAWAAVAALAASAVGTVAASPAQAKEASAWEVATTFDYGGLQTYELATDGQFTWAAHPHRWEGTQGKLTVVDSLNRTATVVEAPAGASPTGLAVNVGARKVYSTDSDTDIVHVWDADTHEYLHGIDLGGGNRGHGLSVDEERNLLYVNSPNGKSHFQVIDSATDTIIKNVEMPDGAVPVQTEFDQSRDRYYVSATTEGAVYVYETGTDELITKISGIPRAHHIAINAAAGEALVASFEAGKAFVIDLDTNTITREIQVTDDWWSIHTVVYHPAYDTYFAASLASNEVFAIDATTYEVYGTYEIGGTVALGMVVNPVTNAVYVGDRDSGQITVLLPTGDPEEPGEPGTPSSATVGVTVVVPEGEGPEPTPLTVTVADPALVALPTPTLDADLGALVTSGELFEVTVSDGRTANPGWNVSGQLPALTGGDGSISGTQLGWTPSVVATSSGQSAVAGDAVAPGVGLAEARRLASADEGAGNGTATLGAGLELQIPTDTPPGTYTGTLTLTAI